MAFENPIAVILRGVQFLFTIITLALSGALVHQQAFGGSPSEVNFALFTSIFSFLCLFYFIFSIFREGHHLILLGLDGLNTVFTLAAGIAMAAALGVQSCSNAAYVLTNKITNGGYNHTGRCHEGQALTAFLWFLFATYAATTVLNGLGSRRGGSTAPSRSVV